MKDNQDFKYTVNIDPEDLINIYIKQWVLEWCKKYHPEAFEEAVLAVEVAVFAVLTAVVALELAVLAVLTAVVELLKAVVALEIADT